VGSGQFSQVWANFCAVGGRLAHENYHTMNGTKAEFSGFLTARLPIRVSYVLVFRVTTHLGGDNSFFFVFSRFFVMFGGVEDKSS
jgi:hypothetical protein